MPFSPKDHTLPTKLYQLVNCPLCLLPESQSLSLGGYIAWCAIKSIGEYHAKREKGCLQEHILTRLGSQRLT
ncbi:hypothetical protein CMV_026077 [Castanea mollissima]|uniref:Uncharacterized protein n=1 Tax=Castanea mollissima TaxID=60419 RepID=A0A8J4Q8E7_9ROSI|nr:hypothetical protein CMV_026077 [Castanea mollissima]